MTKDGRNALFTHDKFGLALDGNVEELEARKAKVKEEKRVVQLFGLMFAGKLAECLHENSQFYDYHKSLHQNCKKKKKQNSVER